MHNFRNLKVCQKSMDLAESIYDLTKGFPEEEKYSLTSQMRRCVVSIASNIAEGSSREPEKDFGRFLSISQGSSFELETQLLIAGRLNYSTDERIDDSKFVLIEIQKMLNALKLKLKS